MVYAFGLILAVYLTATFVGARTYRAFQGTATTGGGRRAGPLVWSIIGLAALIPVLAADPWFPHSSSAVHSWRWLRLTGIGPASGLFGFVTPMLLDRWAGSDRERAGSAYAVNILGCIVGPLLASFLLLPWLSERWALLILASPWLLVGLVPTRPRGRWLLPVVALGLGLGVVLISRGYEDQFPQATVRRDSTATVVAGWDQDHYRLIVNGQGMTYLTPVTKMMAHLPLASLDHLPTRGLVICFGMGTTFRSMLSWGISTTVAELVPSVLQVAGTFHPDAPRLLQSPLARLVVDDGRRFLERTPELFDVITIDPPPPGRGRDRACSTRGSSTPSPGVAWRRGDPATVAAGGRRGGQGRHGGRAARLVRGGAGLPFVGGGGLALPGQRSVDRAPLGERVAGAHAAGRGPRPDRVGTGPGTRAPPDADARGRAAPVPSGCRARGASARRASGQRVLPAAAPARAPVAAERSGCHYISENG